MSTSSQYLKRKQITDEYNTALNEARDTYRDAVSGLGYEHGSSLILKQAYRTYDVTVTTAGRTYAAAHARLDCAEDTPLAIYRAEVATARNNFKAARSFAENNYDSAVNAAHNKYERSKP